MKDYLTKIKIPQRLKNRYAITAIVFCCWIFFFDAASVVDWISQMSENSAIKKDIELYNQQELEVDRQLSFMRSNNDSIEQYARENYFMKRANEEIFLIE